MANWHDAADAKLDLWKFWQSEAGEKIANYFEASIQQRVLEQGEGSHSAYSMIRQIEQQTMYRAEPIWVAPEIMDIAEHASETFRPEAFQPSDLITQSGFVLLPRGFYMPDAQGKTISVRAFAWAPTLEADKNDAEEGVEVTLPAEKVRRQGVWISTYSHMDDLEKETDGYAAVQAVKAARTDLGYSTPFVFLHGVPWWFGETPTSMVDKSVIGKRQTVENAQASTNAWWSFIQTLLRLSMQQMSIRTQMVPPRYTRRRFDREKVELDYTTVITLRRPRSAPKEGEGEPVNWTHRWVVGGHWRNQWYPSLGLHRQVYINDYIKGPEDRPLALRKGRAFNFVR